MGQDESWAQYLANNEPQVESAHSHIVSLDTGLSNILNIEITNLGPSPPSLALVNILNIEITNPGPSPTSLALVAFDLGQPLNS